jgi:hypothetical protein
VFTIWAAVCFVAWIAYGAVLSKRLRRGRAAAPSPRTAAWRAALALFLSLGVIAGAFFGIGALVGRSGEIDVSAWLLTAFTGLLFVHLQVLAAEQLVRSAAVGVTNAAPSPSQREALEGERR